MSKSTDEKEILITVESDGMVRLRREAEDESGRYVDELGCYPCDDCMATQAIRQLFARLSAKEREVERLREALMRIVAATPIVVRITCVPDKVESWCSFASRIQSMAAVAALTPPADGGEGA